MNKNKDLLPVIVTVAHIRRANYCMSGSREWFGRHGFSWNDFLEHGRSADDLEATGEALAFVVTKIAREEAANGQL